MNDSELKGAPIDNAPPPTWVRSYLSEDQLGIDTGIQWVHLTGLAQSLDQAAKNLASRLFALTVGQRQKKVWYSVRKLCTLTGIRSQTTLCGALARLVSSGWLLREERGPGRRPAKPKPGQAGLGYRMAWPLADCMAANDGPLRCAQITTKGDLCTTRAGKGTTHPGQGPCWQHGGDRKAQPEPAPPPDLRPADPVQGTTAAAPMLQLVEHSAPPAPVDNSPFQPPLLLSVGTLNDPTVVDECSNGCGVNAPTTAANAPAVGDPYVRAFDSGIQQMNNGGSGDHGVDVEDAPARTPEGCFEPDSAQRQTLTLELAEQILAALPDGGRALIGRTRYELARAGRPDPAREELLLAAAAAAVRRSA